VNVGARAHLPRRLRPLIAGWGIGLILAVGVISLRTAESSVARAASKACPPSWHVVPSPAVKTGHLLGLAALTARDVWAVGAVGPPASEHENALIEHWDGRAWRVIPNPGKQAGLSGIGGSSSSDVWTVGWSDADSGDNDGLIEHWDGRQWRVVSGPRLASLGISGGFNDLSAVAVVSASDGWIVGTNGGDTLTEHWDGTSWTILPSANGFGLSSLLSVFARAANDVWAVGGSQEELAEHDSEGLIEHWDGTSWQLVYRTTTTNPAYFANVASSSASDIWVIGDRGFKGSDFQVGKRPLLVRWGGRAWRLIASPSTLPRAAIAVFSPQNVWAVGEGVAHRDGRKWRILPNAWLPRRNSRFEAIAALSPANIWAAGADGSGHPLIAHYAC
jgi:hypothetical protein